MAESEAILLTRYARERDPEAFRALIRPHESMVFAVCRRIVGNRMDAEDAAQECFFELVRSANRLRAPIAGWLHRVAMSRAVDILRRRSARQTREDVARRRRAACAEASWPEIRSHVDAAIDDLPEDLKLPLVMYYLEGRTQDEIGTALGVSQPAVSGRLKRALEAVRVRLRKAGVTCPALVLPSVLAAAGKEAAPATLTAALGKMALAGVASAPTAASVAAPAAVAAVLVCVMAGALGMLAWALHAALAGTDGSPDGASERTVATVTAPESDAPYGSSRADGLPPWPGSVVERVLSSGDAGEDMFLDLDSGSLLSLPPDVAEPDAMVKWMRKSGADLLYEPSLDLDSIVGVDLAVAPLSDETARAAGAAQLLQFLGPGARLRTPTRMSLKPSFPRAYAFRTREGSMGILRIAGPSQSDRRGLAIRYRIVRPSPPTGEAERSPA